MTSAQILAKFQHYGDGHFAMDAVLEAIVRRDEVTPALLDVLRDVAENPERYTDSYVMVHIYAIYLLAQFREAAAYPILVRILSLPGEMTDDLVGDLIGGGLGKILASVSHGDISGIRSLIESEEVDSYVRSAAMDALLSLVACGERTREEIVDYFRSLFQTLKREPSDVWSWLACSACDFWLGELMDLLRNACDDGLIEGGIIDWQCVERDHDLGLEACMQKLREHHGLVTDVVAELGSWACFDQNRKQAEQRPLPRLPLPELTLPIRRVGPKVGRNDPCL